MLNYVSWIRYRRGSFSILDVETDILFAEINTQTLVLPARAPDITVLQRTASKANRKNDDITVEG
jgi:hypothetical protein